MEFERAVQELKGHIEDYAEEMLTKSKTRGQYECVFCGSGQGAKATGALTIYENHFYCFSCQQKGDIFDLIQQVEGIDKRQVVQHAAKRYGISIDSSNKGHELGWNDVISYGGTDRNSRKDDYNVSIGESKPPKKEQVDSGNKSDSTKKEEIADYTAFYRECNRHLQETDYHRGISLDTLNRFLVGYVPQWTHPKAPKAPPTPRLIIPTSRTSYLARDTRNAAVIPENQSKYVKSKVGNVHIFNEKALNNTPVLYIVEGEIDALSIIDVGGNAVGLGSASNINSLFKVLDHSGNAQKQKFIISLDNDKAGEKAKNALIDGFCKRSISFCVYNPSGEHKDSNEALMSNKAEFEKAVLYGMENVDKLIKEYGEKENVEYKQTYCAKALLGGFIDGIAANVNTEAIPTGFKALDNILDGGFYEGLYGIGAISSLGKTTFALQIADQIAEYGHQVLIFSLEMSQNELIAKSISRNTFKRVIATSGDAKNAKTTRGIMTGKKYPFYNQTERELIKAAVNDYDNIAENLFIREGMGNVGADTIVEQVKEHIRKGNKPPVVIVDYLQILMPHSERGTDKTNTDYAILTLKRLSRDYKIPVVVISSFNRENYSNKVSMQAFKESGAIEYSTDVLIGLQLMGTGAKDFDVDTAKSKNPREIEAVILKNRNGRTGGKIGYNFYAMFNYFSELGEISDSTSTNTANTPRKAATGGTGGKNAKSKKKAKIEAEAVPDTDLMKIKSYELYADDDTDTVLMQSVSADDDEVL